jgi:hypothetical protein
MERNDNKVAEGDANRDPLSNEPGAHPVGVGMGAAGGAATGAAMGAIAGPVGIGVGAAVGGLVGGLAGKAIAEGMNPSVEEIYWRENYASRPYVPKGTLYAAYEPAYRYGWEARGRYGELNWDKAEAQLEREWAHARGDSRLSWDEARRATRDAWDRLRPSADYSGENR